MCGNRGVMTGGVDSLKRIEVKSQSGSALNRQELLFLPSRAPLRLAFFTWIRLALLMCPALQALLPSSRRAEAFGCRK